MSNLDQYSCRLIINGIYCLLDSAVFSCLMNMGLNGARFFECLMGSSRSSSKIVINRPWKSGIHKNKANSCVLNNLCTFYNCKNIISTYELQITKANLYNNTRYCKQNRDIKKSILLYTNT